MKKDIIKDFKSLRIRVRNFLSSNRYNIDDINKVIHKILPLGDLVIFGGMLRDISILGSAGFNSDVDLVIKTNDFTKVEESLDQYRPIKNKFGGYRIQLSKWKIDLWEFNSTWAFKNGYVEGSNLKDLCKTTFFDWDAIIFNIGNGEISAIDGYIERIRSNLLDINLEKNVNVKGTIIKAIRYYQKFGVTYSPRLATYIYNNMKTLDLGELNIYEANSFDWPYITEEMLKTTLNSLYKHQVHSPYSPFKPDYLQRSLFE